METNLTSKTIVVTGATSGIGLAAVETLANQGYSVIGVARSSERCREVERRLRTLYPQVQINYCVSDLSRQSQVRQLANQVEALLEQQGKSCLDGLINNAGTFTYWMSLTPEGFETQWAVNHLAPFLLTHELLPLLRAAPAARVVTVSSDSHYGTRMNWNDIQLRRAYNGLRAYGQTKMANVLFTLELNRLLGPGSTVHAFAADPGLVKTEIGFKGTPALVRWIWQVRRSGGISAEESARGIVYLATEPSIQDAEAIYWKAGSPKPASRHALDPVSARRLWEISAQMCGLSRSLVANGREQ